MTSDPKTPLNTRLSKADIEQWLRRCIAESVHARPDEIDVTLPFSHYGLDSIASLGISSELEIWLGRELPQTLTWDHPTIEELLAFLTEGEVR
jgi:acyl carrier protein